MRPSLPLVTAVFVITCVALLVLVLADRADDHEYEQVKTTNEVTPTTTWPAETAPALPDGFNPEKLKLKPKRVMRASSKPMPGGAPYPTDDLLLALARCETGGTMDQRATSKSGRYLSFFQWALSTWHSIGGTGDPRDHPYSVQAPLARALILRSGWGQFPVCSRAIGAR